MKKSKAKHAQPPAEYRSGFERKIREFLKQNKIPFEYETRKFSLTLPVTHHKCNVCGGTDINRRVSYTPDFLLTAKDIVVESKGKFTARDRKLALAMLEQYPLEQYRMVFQRDNWLSSKKAQKYSDWCRKHGIEFHVGTDLPKEWWA
jgi:hypothetical protein